MAEYKGRYSAKLDGDFVVFLIGARINQLWRVNKWLPVMQSMPRMLKELAEHPGLGLLHVEYFRRGRTVMTVQYWRSFEQLHAYAHAKDKEHLPAWAAFNRAVGGNGAVGVFHESYLVRAGEFECVYVNMPPMLMTKAGEIVPATGARQDAKSRLRAGAAAE